MKTPKDIRNYVNKKRKQGYEGYKDMTKYFEKFSLEQLNYIIIDTKARIGEYERLNSFKNIFTLVIAVFALVSLVTPIAEKASGLSQMLFRI